MYHYLLLSSIKIDYTRTHDTNFIKNFIIKIDSEETNEDKINEIAKNETEKVLCILSSYYTKNKNIETTIINTEEILYYLKHTDSTDIRNRDLCEKCIEASMHIISLNYVFNAYCLHNYTEPQLDIFTKVNEKSKYRLIYMMKAVPPNDNVEKNIISNAFFINYDDIIEETYNIRTDEGHIDYNTLFEMLSSKDIPFKYILVFPPSVSLQTIFSICKRFDSIKSQFHILCKNSIDNGLYQLFYKNKEIMMKRINV